VPVLRSIESKFYLLLPDENRENMQLAVKEGAIKVCNRQKSYFFMSSNLYRGIYLQAQAALDRHLMLQRREFWLKKIKQLRFSTSSS